jgi:DNA-binding transcriptional regulator WhiA
MWSSYAIDDQVIQCFTNYTGELMRSLKPVFVLSHGSLSTNSACEYHLMIDSHNYLLMEIEREYHPAIK